VTEIRKQVGRPEKTDSDGTRIVTKVINVNVPIRLIEFLKDEGVNRSELFTKVATSYFEREICNQCYTKLTQTPAGSCCDQCAFEYYTKTKDHRTFWKQFNNCPNCNEAYSHENLYAPNKQGLHGCQVCSQPKQEKLDINECEPSEKNDAI